MKTRGPSEAQIQKQIDDFLELDGWRIIRTDLPHLRGLGVQEKGIPDRLYIRYWAGLSVRGAGIAEKADLLAETQSLWIEHKKLRGRLSEHQEAWHAAERARGALVIVAGQDFHPSLDSFCQWYGQSGLQRVSVRLAK